MRISVSVYFPFTFSDILTIIGILTIWKLGNLTHPTTVAGVSQRPCPDDLNHWAKIMISIIYRPALRNSNARLITQRKSPAYGRPQENHDKWERLPGWTTRHRYQVVVFAREEEHLTPAFDRIGHVEDVGGEFPYKTYMHKERVQAGIDMEGKWSPE